MTARRGRRNNLSSGKRIRSVLFAVMLTFASGQGSKAYYVTGNDLLKMCSGSANEQSQCLGYLQGDLDDLEIRLYHSGYPLCPPAGTRIQDVRDAVLRYLQQFPKGHDLLAPSIIGAAVGATWKCSGTRNHS